jgi:dTDP-4-dehydrorhamnose reductase
VSARPVLITGASGQLGNELVRQNWPAALNPVALPRDALDLSDAEGIRETLRKGHGGKPWAGVINGAAFTAVDKAETAATDAWQINALAPGLLARECQQLAIPLIHVSTDYVFDGSKDGPWQVDDPVAPLNVYGASKLGGELAVRFSGARHAIVRTSWVVSAYGANFVKTMLRLARERDEIQVVSDQIGCPTSAADLAAALIAIIARLIAETEFAGGTYHFSNAGVTNWAEFAETVFALSAAREGPRASVRPIATSAYPTPARRPKNSLLCHASMRETFGIIPRPWQDALADIVDELAGETK